MRTNTVSMLYKSTDKVQRNFGNVHINVQTATILPVHAVLQSSTLKDKLSIKAAQMAVGDLYRPSPDQPLQLTARTAASIPFDIRRAHTKILKQIDTNKVQVQPFFASLQQPPLENSNSTTEISFLLFVDALQFSKQNGLHPPVSTRTFRKARTAAYSSNIVPSN